MNNKNDSPVAVLVTLMIGMMLALSAMAMVVVSFVTQDHRYMLVGYIMVITAWIIRLVLVPTKRR